jgi:hypothetical protein
MIKIRNVVIFITKAAFRNLEKKKDSDLSKVSGNENRK